MKLPFTVDEFFQVFKNYNQSVYPMQIILYLLAATVIFLSIRRVANANRIINIVLSFFWIWMGIVYHLIYFTQINKLAYAFGGIFILQGFLFFYYGVLKNKLSFKFTFDTSGWTGALLIAYALIIYPVLNYQFGHSYPATPTFGLPCPTTIFTFGILMWADQKIPFSILIIPLIWSIIGFSAALTLDVLADVALLVSGILGIITVGLKNKKIIYSTN